MLKGCYRNINNVRAAEGEMRREIIPGRHDWDGQYMPEKNPSGSETFSVGIFRWTNGGIGIRRGNVIYRVRGYWGNSKAVYRRATQLCEAFDKEVKANPGWPGPIQMSEWVRG